MDTNFSIELLNNSNLNPFQFFDPDRSWKPSVFVDTDNYIQWYGEMVANANSQGYCISFIVGDPGAGKTHFLCHNNYRYYVKNDIQGFYSIYSAKEEKITPTLLWMDFFSNIDVIERLTDSEYGLKIWELEHYRFPRIGMKKYIFDYLQDPSLILEYTPDMILQMAEGISHILSQKGQHISIVIDNIDEYFRWLDDLRTENRNNEVSVSTPESEDVSTLFHTLRSTATNMRSFLLILACTVDSYIPIQENAVRVDRTLAGRVTFHDKRLGPLSFSQTCELISEYMAAWAKDYEVELPEHEECSVNTMDGVSYNIYPFTEVSLREIFNVTGQYARDIKSVCNEAILDMRKRSSVYLVKNENLYHIINEAHKKREQIIPVERMQDFKNRRVEWIKNTIQPILEENEAHYFDKYKVLDNDTILSSVSTYLETLNIEVERNVPQIPNSYNYAYMTASENMLIAKISDETSEVRILLSFIIGKKTSKTSLFKRDVTIRDQRDAISYIDSDRVSHILFIYYNTNPRKPDIRRDVRPFELDEVIDEFSIDDYIYKIITAIQLAENENERQDYVEHIDRYHINLLNRLKLLALKNVPEEDWERKRQQMRRDASKF